MNAYTVSVDGGKIIQVDGKVKHIKGGDMKAESAKSKENV
jgi:major membrane immunogen (membrane-anchored lipoprotein)